MVGKLRTICKVTNMEPLKKMIQGILKIISQKRERIAHILQSIQGLIHHIHFKISQRELFLPLKQHWRIMSPLTQKGWILIRKCQCVKYLLKNYTCTIQTLKVTYKAHSWELI
jgi:hypothetical protein